MFVEVKWTDGLYVDFDKTTKSDFTKVHFFLYPQNLGPTKINEFTISVFNSVKEYSLVMLGLIIKSM